MKSGGGGEGGAGDPGIPEGGRADPALIWREKDPDSGPSYSRGWSCWLKEQQAGQRGQSRAGKGGWVMSSGTGLTGGHMVLGFRSALVGATVGLQAEEKWALPPVSEGPRWLLGRE